MKEKKKRNYYRKPKSTQTILIALFGILITAYAFLAIGINQAYEFLPIGFGGGAFFLLMTIFSRKQKWPSVVFIVLGVIFLLSMPVVLIIFCITEEASFGDVLSSLFYGFIASFLLGGYFLFTGIIGIRNVKKYKKAKKVFLALHPYKKRGEICRSFKKDGVTIKNHIITSNYAGQITDEKNLSPFSVSFADRIAVYRQTAVLFIGDRLFVAGEDITDDNSRSENVYFFECTIIPEGNALRPVSYDETVFESVKQNYYALFSPLHMPEKTTDEQTKSGKTENAPEEKFLCDRMSEKGKKSVMVIMCCIYGILLVLSILTMFTTIFDNLFSMFDVTEKERQRIYGFVFGFMWLTTLPSLGYYFATVAPIHPKKKVRIFLFLCTIVLSAVVDVLFLFLTKEKRNALDNNDQWFMPFSVVAGSVGILLIYLLTFMRLDTSKLRKFNTERLSSSNDLFDQIKGIFFWLVNVIVTILQFLIYFSVAHTTVYVLISSILFTVLLPFAAFLGFILVAALFISGVAMLLSGAIHIAYEPSKNMRFTVIDDSGSTRILTYDSYDSFRSRDRYKDDLGNYWYMNEDGNTFTKE